MNRARRLLTAVITGLLASALVAVVTPTTAYAAPTWLPAVTASSGETVIDDPDVVVDAQGNATALWLTSRRDEETDESVDQLATATRPAGAADFGPVQTLPEGSSRGQLVAHPDGAVTIVFTVGASLRATTRPSGVGAFPVSGGIALTPPGSSMTRLAAAVDGAGVLTVISVIQGPDDDAIFASTRAPGSGSWSSGPLVSQLPSVNALVAAADNDGTVTVAWQQDELVVAATRLPGSGSWIKQPIVLAGAPHLDLAVTTDGRTALAVRTNRDPEGSVTLVLRPDPAAPFESPLTRFPQSGALLDGPVVELDAAGRAILAWIDGDGAVRSGTVEPDGSMTHGVVSPGDPTTEALSSTIDARGAVTLAWHKSAGSHYLVAARRPEGGAFAPVQLTDPEQGNTQQPPALAADPEGDVTVVYDFKANATGSRSFATAQVLDAAAPTLTAGQPPGTGTGAAVSLAAVATDRWSGPAAITWDFGDGRSATGASTSHVYAAAGSYVVRVTATDAVGNASTLTRTVTVTDATAPVLSGARLRPGLLPTGVGARLKVTSSERASLAGVVQRKRDGGMAGHRHQAVVRDGRRQHPDVLREDLRAAAEDRALPGAADRDRLRRQPFGHHHPALPR